MKQLAFVAAIFLVISIGFAKGSTLDDISDDDDDFSVDLIQFNPFNPANGPNDYNADDEYGYIEIYFDDIDDTDHTNKELELIKLMLMNQFLLKRIAERLGLNETVRFQDNRFWNLTYLPVLNPVTQWMHVSMLVNLEIKNASKTKIEFSQEHYDPLPGQYCIQIYLDLVGNPFEKILMKVKLRNVTKVVDLKHPDGVQMNILNEVLPKIQERFGSDQPVRYGRFLFFNSLSTENTTEFSQLLQVVTFFEKRSPFCRDTYPLPVLCPYIPIHFEIFGSTTYILVKQYAGNGTVVLADYTN